AVTTTTSVVDQERRRSDHKRKVSHPREFLLILNDRERALQRGSGCELTSDHFLGARHQWRCDHKICKVLVDLRLCSNVRLRGVHESAPTSTQLASPA